MTDAPAAPPRDWLRAAAAALGVGLALAAQWRLDVAPEAPWDGAILFALGGAAWLYALWRGPEAAPHRPDAPMPVVAGPRLTRRRWALLGGGLALALLSLVIWPAIAGPQGGGLGVLRYPGAEAWPWRSNNRFTLFGTPLWLAGTAIVAYALAARRARGAASASQEGAPDAAVPGARAPAEDADPTAAPEASAAPNARWWRERRTWAWGLAVLGAMGLAALMRWNLLDLIPYELTSDHTEKLLDVHDVLRGARPVFFQQNAGREPYEFYLAALLVGLGLPASFLTLKRLMTSVGVAALPFTYLLGKETHSRLVGLMAALLLALAPWHVQISRAAMRIAFAPLFAALTLWLLFRALRRGGRNDYLWMGLALGLGMYGYTGFRPMALFLALAIPLRVAHDLWHHRAEAAVATRSGLGALAGHVAAAAGLSLLVAGPLIRYAIDQPEWFGARTMTRIGGDGTAVDGAAALAALDWGQLSLNYLRSLAMVNLTADSAWIHSPPGRPGLETVGGALFVLGALTGLYLALRRRDWASGLLLVCIPVMMLAAALAIAFPIEVPSLSRASGALPAVVVLAALPLATLPRMLDASLGRAGAILGGLVVAAGLLSMADTSWTRYTDEYAPNYDLSTHNTSEGVAVVEAFRTLGGDLDHVYLVGWAHGWDYRALGLAFGAPDWNGLLWVDAPGGDAAELAAAHVDDPAPKLYLLGGPEAPRGVETLRGLFPDALVTEHASRVETKDFWSVIVPAAEEAGP